MNPTTAPAAIEPSAVAIGFFFVFVAATMGITYWAARKTKTASEFFAAGGNITAGQNGLALAGDYMSAASFLGIAGMVSLSGFDGLIYSVGFLVGWPLVMFLVAEPLRNLGKFTFADVLAARLRHRPIRIASSCGSLTVISFYLIAQMVGAGDLIRTLFGLTYETAVLIVGAVMILYVLFGGMIATTWVQIIKAGLLLGGATLLAILVLSRFHMNPIELFAEAARMNGPSMLGPGKQVASPIDAISLGMALMLGTAGLPHILMRFYTVPDASTARRSVFYATGLIGFFYLVTFVLGFGASVLVGQKTIAAASKGGNMAALLLAQEVGGKGLLGFISAVAFATILAVVAGLTLSGAATLAHDLWVSVIRKGQSNETEQLRVARVATLSLGILAVVLGLSFKGQNVAFMVGLAFAIAASANLPALLMSLLWRKFTTAGAVVSMVAGNLTAITLIVLSPTVWVDILKHPAALFPLKNPAIVSVPLATLAGIIVSLVSPSADDAQRFGDVQRRTLLGSDS